MGLGFAYVDISTGTFAVTTWDTPHWQQALRREYERVQPREVLVPAPTLALDIFEMAADTFTTVATLGGSIFVLRKPIGVNPQFAVHTLEGFGCEGYDLFIAAGCIISICPRDTTKRYKTSPWLTFL